MSYYQSIDLGPRLPRNGHTYEVCIVVRLSTKMQDPKSLDDQEARCRREIHRFCRKGFKINIRVLRGIGSGEDMTRPEFLELQRLIAGECLDLIITEDFARICRNMIGYELVRVCTVKSIRVVAINDSIDSQDPNWRYATGFAALRHESYTADTAARIRRTAIHRFNCGGMVTSVPPGYIKPHAKCTDDQLRKDPDFEPVVPRVFQMLERGDSFSDISVWLNQRGMRPHARGCKPKISEWNQELVGRWVRNPILKGVRSFGNHVTSMNHEAGKKLPRRSKQEDIVYRECPHLAFIAPADFDRIIRAMEERNRRYNTRGARPGMCQPMKFSAWPCRALRCAVCGRMMTSNGSGHLDHYPLYCGGAKDYRCWHYHSVRPWYAGDRIMEAIVNRIQQMPGFDKKLLGRVRAQIADAQQAAKASLEVVGRQVRGLEARCTNLVRAIAKNPDLERLPRELAERERELALARGRYEQTEYACRMVPEVPDMETIRRRLLEDLGKLREKSPREFSAQMRQLVPVVWVVTYMVRGGNMKVQKAYFELRLMRLCEESIRLPEELASALNLRFEVVISPLPRVLEHTEEIHRLERQGLATMEIRRRFDMSHAMFMAALKWSRQMPNGKLDDLLEVLNAPRMHLKSARMNRRRFKFRIEPGHTPFKVYEDSPPLAEIGTTPFQSLGAG